MGVIIHFLSTSRTSQYLTGCFTWDKSYPAVLIGNMFFPGTFPMFSMYTHRIHGANGISTYIWLIFISVMGYSPPSHSLPLPSASLHRLAKFQTRPSTFEAFPNGWGSLVLGCPAGTLRIPKDPPMGQGEWTCVVCVWLQVPGSKWIVSPLSSTNPSGNK